MSIQSFIGRHTIIHLCSVTCSISTVMWDLITSTLTLHFCLKDAQGATEMIQAHLIFVKFIIVFGVNLWENVLCVKKNNTLEIITSKIALLLFAIVIVCPGGKVCDEPQVLDNEAKVLEEGFQGGCNLCCAIAVVRWGRGNGICMGMQRLADHNAKACGIARFRAHEGSGDEGQGTNEVTLVEAFRWVTVEKMIEVN